MKTRKHIPTKILTASATGEVTRHEAGKISTEARIKQLINALGIDAEDYKLKASLRKFGRAYALGINL
jgi:hypothetical protein